MKKSILTILSLALVFSVIACSKGAEIPEETTSSSRLLKSTTTYSADKSEILGKTINYYDEKDLPLKQESYSPRTDPETGKEFLDLMATTIYEYNDKGLLIYSKNTNNKTNYYIEYKYTYNAKNQILSTLEIDNGKKEQEIISYYNSDGTESKYERYEFDNEENRLSSPSVTVTYTYENGKLIKQTNSSGQYFTFEYDSRGNEASETCVYGVEELFRYEYTYNEKNQKTKQKYYYNKTLNQITEYVYQNDTLSKSIRKSPENEVLDFTEYEYY